MVNAWTMHEYDEAQVYEETEVQSLASLCKKLIVQQQVTRNKLHQQVTPNGPVGGCVLDPFRTLPYNLFCDLCCQLANERMFALVRAQFDDIDAFYHLVKHSERCVLIKGFQAFVSHTQMKLLTNLMQSFDAKCIRELVLNRADASAQPMCVVHADFINMCLVVGEFLSETGWYYECAHMLDRVIDIKDAEVTVVRKFSSHVYYPYVLCAQLFMHVQALAIAFDHEPFRRVHAFVAYALEIAESQFYEPLLPALFAEKSLHHFARSEYNEAYDWSMRSLKYLTSRHNARMVVDVLRQASKACVYKRKFRQAGMLIREACALVRAHFKDTSRYADVLMDYGFFLINSDYTGESVSVYEKALEKRLTLFGDLSLKVAVAHEDYAYALYVHEYTTGNFSIAQDHVNIAIDIMEKIYAKENVTESLRIASANRVRALILEEIAVDLPQAVPPMVRWRDQNGLRTPEHRAEEYLRKAEELHLSALQLSQKTYGMKNVHTGKHLGNLGRLYQSMKNYTKSEQMHLRAIEIKMELLGPDDYEVGLSLGHLASLYNYHMAKYRKAEQLHLKSMEISKKIYGKCYSGLEYDYRGLVHVYSELEDYDKMVEYTEILHTWITLRDDMNERFHLNTDRVFTNLDQTDLECHFSSVEELVKNVLDATEL